MSINQGKYNGDLDVWGLTHNYFHEHLNHGYEHIEIINSTAVIWSTGENVPVIKAGTAFMLYSSAIANITSQALGNNCFPPSTTISYPNHLAVFEPFDVETRKSTSGISSTDRFTYTVSLNNTAVTYFLLCDSVDNVSSTSIGLGHYTISSSTQVTLDYDYTKGGFYSSDGLRFLAKWHFISTTLGLEINQIYRKDIRYNINPQTSAYTAQNYDDVIILNSTVGEFQDNSDGSFLGVKNTFVNVNASTATIYGDLTNNTSVQILPMAAMSFIGGSTSWYIISQYSSTVITSTSTVLTNLYDTGWVENLINSGSPDWTGVQLSSSGTGSTSVNHGLNCGLDQIIIKLLVSTDGTDANSFELSVGDQRLSGTNTYGTTAHYVDANNIIIQTATNGIVFTNLTGARVFLDTDAYYYRIIVIRLTD